MQWLKIGIALALGAGTMQSQEEAASPAFEVASIKPHVFDGPSGGCGRFSISGNHVTLPCLSLRNLILRAYGVKLYQISGGPGWLREMGDTAYDIAAVAPGTASPTNDQVNEMLKSLLASRFQLKVHRETKEIPIYSLVVGKDGPKMKESAPDARGGASFRIGGYMGSMKASRESMSQLALYLSSQLDRPVFDKTGLSGNYEVSLEWTRDEPVNLPGTTAPAAPPEPRGPSLFTALQEQLGLKLEAGKGAVELLVVDHAARPSDN